MSATSLSALNAPGKIRIAVIGCNHRTAPLELRERVVFSPEQARRAATELRERGLLEESVVVSTCNRSELYGVPSAALVHSPPALDEFFGAFHGLAPAEMNGRLYRHADLSAVRHLFRVTAGLDSMLLGESEILGQVRDAYQRALEHGSTGPVMNRLFQSALEVGKRVRAETEVGARPMSVAFAGVKLAERVFGKLKDHCALILGAGSVAEQVVEHLQNRGVRRLIVVNRSRDHGLQLADRFHGQSIPWENLEQALELPDIVVASVGEAGAVVTAAVLEAALNVRSGRPMFFVDLGVPRNIDPAAAKLDNVYLYNIDDLGEIVEQNRRARESEIPRAESLIEEQIARFASWQAQVEALDVLAKLRVRFHAEGQSFLRERLAAIPNLSDEDRQRYSRLTEELIESILATPEKRLRRERGLRRRLEEIEALADFFGLDEENR
ncbi:MAG: glutamyl-tRNA reductase [Candidatus Acidiferrales bacterium]